jgi:hypothetical protein
MRVCAAPGCDKQIPDHRKTCSAKCKQAKYRAERRSRENDARACAEAAAQGLKPPRMIEQVAARVRELNREVSETTSAPELKRLGDEREDLAGQLERLYELKRHAAAKASTVRPASWGERYMQSNKPLTGPAVDAAEAPQMGGRRIMTGCRCRTCTRRRRLRPVDGRMRFLRPEFDDALVAAA